MMPAYQQGNSFSLSLVVPILNEEGVVDEFYRRASNVLQKITPDHEFIFVDDGSSDGTFSRLQTLHKQDPCVKILSFSRNFGHQMAMSAGLDYALGDATIVIDGDLQHPPEAIPQFIKKWHEGYDVVYGVQKKRREPFVRRIGLFISHRILRYLSSVSIPVNAGNFSLFSRRAREAFSSMHERVRFVRGLRSWIGFRQTGIEFEQSSRFSGKTKYSFGALAKLAFDGAFAFSQKPLRFVTWLGFSVFILSLLGGLWHIWVWTSTGVINPGFFTIVTLIFFFGGMQLFCIGMIGEYLGRTYEEIKRRPLYILKKKVGFKTE